ncbi:MAG: signal peptidase I [Eubacteriales bacterium]|nr:signal peptidase I [Eubacteriales bacterium]
MKNILTGVLIGLIIILAGFGLVAATNGTPFLTYVYSDSMSPLIDVNDAFLIWPTGHYEIGDVITYRPKTLPATYITHRIVGKNERGFLTQGDHAPYQDQRVGEPPISDAQIAGEVLSLYGQPLIIPQLGTLAAGIGQGLGPSSSWVAILLIAAGIISLIWNRIIPSKKKKTRLRWRLRHLYRLVGVIATVLILTSVLVLSQVTQVRYLVSEKPSQVVNRVLLNHPGELSMTVRNQGLWPVWLEVAGTGDTVATKASRIVWPYQETKVTLMVPAESSTGWYQRYLHINQYPILFPEGILRLFYQFSPVAALVATLAAFWLWYRAWIGLISRIHGLEGWIPLKTFRDKIAARRWRNLRRRLISKKERTL